MSHEAYRAPGAVLTGPDDRLPPRSPFVAVVLGFLAATASSAAGMAVAELRSSRIGVAMSALSGTAAGWAASRYRRGPWLGVTLAIAVLHAAIVLLIAGLPSRWTDLPWVLLAGTLLGDFIGGYLGRGR